MLGNRLQPPYGDAKQPYMYTKLSESCKQVKIINQNHISWAETGR